MRAFVVAGCLCLLAACTSLGWQRPEAGRADTSSDLAACGETAQRDAVRAAPHPPPGPRLLPRGSGDIENPAWDMPQELLLQQSLRNECMRERGYRLGPQAARVP
jgi:hypothetical protein